MGDHVKIQLDVILKFQAQPELWNDLWRIGRMSGEHYLAPKEAFDALCRHHFHAFAPGEIIHTLAQPVARLLTSFGVSLEDCNCAGRRLMLNAVHLTPAPDRGSAPRSNAQTQGRANS